MAFDLLALGDDDRCSSAPFAERRARLEQVLADGDAAGPPHADDHRPRRSPQDWFVRFEGAGLDGVMAKPADRPYLPDKRVQLKVKHQRTADCVVAGFRWHKNGDGVGSLLLGLYDDDGRLHHVGVASVVHRGPAQGAASTSWRPTATTTSTTTRGGEWADAEAQAHGHGRMPGRPVSRWNADKDLSFDAAAPRAGGRGRLRAACDAAASATAPASCAGAPTARPDAAPTTSSTWSPPTSSHDIFL